MKLFQKLLVAPAALGLLTPLTVSASEVNLDAISNYSNNNFEIDEIRQLDLPVNYKFENTIEFLLKIFSNLNTFEINEDKVIYKTTIQCLLEKKKYKGFDPDELLDSIQNKIKLEGFSSDKINQWITFSRNIMSGEVDFPKLNFKEGSLGTFATFITCLTQSKV